MTMGLRKCFEAADTFAFRASGSSVFPQRYNTYLKAPPRRFIEEIYPTVLEPGTLWVTGQANAYGATSINFLAPAMAYYYWPSWTTGWWKIDGQYGRLFFRYDNADDASFDTVTQDRIVAEPDGSLWAYGIHADAYYSGPRGVSLKENPRRPDESFFAFDPTRALAVGEFEGAVGGSSNTAVFAIDRASDRVFVRWSTNGLGQVSVYPFKFTGGVRPKLFDIYTPNEVASIILTHDGTAYVVDKLGWIVVYGFDGAYGGAMRHPWPAEALDGVTYGWDRFYKRILYLPGTRAALDGASTLRVQGFYPVPDPSLATAPIPRKAPRRGRRVEVVSHLCGEGGEPLAGYSAALGGLASSSDRDGDFAATITPEAAGTLDVEIVIP